MVRAQICTWQVSLQAQIKSQNHNQARKSLPHVRALLNCSSRSHLLPLSDLDALGLRLLLRGAWNLRAQRVSKSSSCEFTSQWITVLDTECHTETCFSIKQCNGLQCWTQADTETCFSILMRNAGHDLLPKIRHGRPQVEALRHVSCARKGRKECTWDRMC